MHFCCDGVWHELADLAFNFGLERCGKDVIFSGHERFEALPGHIGGIVFVFSFRPEFRIVHSGTMEKIRVRSTWPQMPAEK